MWNDLWAIWHCSQIISLTNYRDKPIEIDLNLFVYYCTQINLKIHLSTAILTYNRLQTSNSILKSTIGVGCLLDFNSC